MSDHEKLSPEEELKSLCNFTVKDCVAHISEISPGAEFFVLEDVKTLIKSLQKTPDLTGLIIDGFTSVHRPGILKDGLVFYNLSEEEMLEHLAKVERNEHVRWIFNGIMDIYDMLFKMFREALPNIKIVYSVDSDDFHNTCERMLRVIIQSNKARALASKKSLEEHLKDLEARLNGSNKLKKPDLQKKLYSLEDQCKKQKERGDKRRAKEIDNAINQVKSEIALLDKLNELETRIKVFRDAKDKKLIEQTETELVEVRNAIKSQEQGMINALYTLNADRDRLISIKGKQKERDALDREIKNCKAKISEIENQIMDIFSKIETLDKTLSKLGRDAETSAVYQRRVSEHVRKLYKRFYQLGEKYDIQILTEPSVIVFGSLTIDYAHDHRRTWHPMPKDSKNLAKKYHGIMDEYRENITETLKEMGSNTTDIDVIMESGHSGGPFVRWQRLNLTAEEIRMQHVNTFYTGGSDGVKHVVFLVGMPFEAQDKIAPYLNRGKPGRTRGGKPMGSASHPVFVRNSQGSLSGVFLVRKHNNDIISVEPILYHLYRTKDVLKPFVGVASQDDSDNHFSSPEMDALGTLGTFAMNDQLMDQPLELYGKKIYLGAKFNLGDTGEANSRAWKEGHKFRREILEVAEEISEQLVSFDQTDPESVQKAALYHLNDMMGGSQENLKLTQRTVALYLKKQLLNVYHKSPTRLRDIIAHVTGNHFDNANRDSAIQEHDAFENWLQSVADLHKDFPNDGYKPFPVKIMAGGEPRYFQPDTNNHEIVAHTGGYSTSRQAIIEEFGIGFNGKPFVQKTYRVGLTHEPNSILNKARNCNADIMKAGHTHESYLTIDKSGHNKGRFIDQIGTTQRVTATELGYGGLPRTAGVEIKIYSQPGRYFKMFIPMEHMRRIGLAWLKNNSKQAIDNKKNKTK